MKMKYVEKRFALRLHRRDGTSKLLLGVTGIPRDEVVTVKMKDHPHGEEPAEAMEESSLNAITASEISFFVERLQCRRRYRLVLWKLCSCPSVDPSKTDMQRRSLCLVGL